MTPRIGAFVCDCQGQISDYIDTSRVAAMAAQLEDVVFIDRRPLLCTKTDLRAAVDRLRQEGCNRLLFVGCSPRSSLKFPEERIAGLMEGAGLCPELFEVANVREQCAWQHRSDHEGATAKALDLVRMAHARLRGARIAASPVPIPKRALVIGGGSAGVQAAKDLAAAGVAVTLVERSTYIGGRLCQIPRLFQSEGWPSVCDSACVGPVQAKGVILDEGIEPLTQTEVVSAERCNGGFRVTFRQAPQHVDFDRCICCDLCAQACPEEAPSAFDAGLRTRKAIAKDFERALPDSYTIIEELCTKCGDCVPACPTQAIDLAAKPRIFTEDFGAVFIATGFEPLDLSAYEQYTQSHPNVVTSLELERIIDGGFKRPSDGQVVEQVVFLQCAGSRAGPGRKGAGVPYCSKTCCSVTAKQVDRLVSANPEAEATVIYYRDMRTYERALEELYQRLQAQGLDFINGEVSGITPGAGVGSLTVKVDPYVPEEADSRPEPLQLEADLVVLAAAQTPSRGSRELCRLFGVELDRYGFPIENQPRIFRPTESLVERVYAVGAGVGPKVVQHACEQGSAAAMRALPVLQGGWVRPRPHASRISSERCCRCGSCLAVCPHGAIRLTEQGAVSDPAFCQACGFCAAACPVHAAQLNNFTDEQILAQAAVAFSELPPDEPRILALLCYWCAYSAADFAGIQRDEAPLNHRVMRIRCSSSVNTALLMKMYQQGIDGILLGGCPERSCHHLWGNFVADKRTDLTRLLLSQLGLDAARLRFEYIGAPMRDKLLDALRSMDERLRALGPIPVASR